MLALKTEPHKSTKADKYHNQLNKLNQVGQLCLFSPSNRKNGRDFVRYGKDVKDLLHYVDNERNWYISFNSFNGYHRAEDNTLGLNGFFIDCDCQKAGIDKGRFMWDILMNHLLTKAGLPKPTAIKDSGHGIHLIYLFKHQVIIHNQSINRLWNKIERILVKRLNKESRAFYGVEIGDMKATDSSRVLRVINSWNVKKHPVQCFLSVYNPNETHDLFNYWVNYLPKINYKKPSRAKIRRIRQFKKNLRIKLTFKHGSTLTLNLFRALDLKTWLKMKNYSIKGCREEFLFLYACFAIHCESVKSVMKNIRYLNGKLTEPLDNNEISNLETELNHVNFKSYRFKSSKIIELLHITPKDQKHLRTIISKDEKYARRKIKRHELSRKNKANRSKKIMTLFKQGLSYRKIAKNLEISLGTVESTIKEHQDTSNRCTNNCPLYSVLGVMLSQPKQNHNTYTEIRTLFDNFINQFSINNLISKPPNHNLAFKT